MKKTMTIVWKNMDADGCGAGADGEDYRLLYNVKSNAQNSAEWEDVINAIKKVAAEFTMEDDETESPCTLLFGGDKLCADEYIAERMAELMPDVEIELQTPTGFTVEID